MMRVLALLFALLAVPLLAAASSPDVEPSAGLVLLAQMGQQPQQQQQQQQQGPSVPQRHPGDYCTRHCRKNEMPCGDKCLSTTGPIKPKCFEKVTTACPGKP